VPPGTDARQALLGALADPDEGVRQQALIAAQAGGLPMLAEVIAGLALNDPSEVVRMLAMDLLTMTAENDRETARALLQRVAQDPSPAIRDHAAGLLSALNAQAAGAAPDTGTVPDLDTVMRDLEAGDENVRQQALVAAQAHGIPVAPERLEEILRNDASDGVRVAALSAIAVNPEIDPERIRAWLEWAERDPSPLVREQAAALLGDLNLPTDMPEEPAPDDSSPEVPDDAPLDDPVGDGSGEVEDPSQ
jgi:HEAT repeat protein